MKRVLSRITAAILVSATLGACAPVKDSSHESGTIRVMAPLNANDGSYKLGFTELVGIEDLNTLAGKFVRFFMSPRLANGHLDGTAPKTRFVKNSDGVFVPADDSTMQMVTIYAHMQKLAALDTELGAEGVNTWPRDVGVAVRVNGNLRNNAFYEGKTDSVLVVPYVAKNLAIAVNGGILAHEHFHSLFYKIVLDQSTIAKGMADTHRKELEEVLGQDLDQTLSGSTTPVTPVGELNKEQLNYYYHIAVTRGLNEGLADFWGWMYTGDPDFIVQSLPSETKRSMKVSAAEAAGILSGEARITQKVFDIFEFSLNNNSDFQVLINNYAYSLGTEYSRSLKRYTDLYASSHGIESLAARKEVAKIIIKMLPTLKTELSQSAEKVFTARTFVESFAKHAQMKSAEECNYLQGLVMNAEPLMSKLGTECRKENDQWNLIFNDKEPVTTFPAPSPTPTPTPSPAPTQAETTE